MEFWNKAVDLMKLLVIAYGAYMCVQGGIGLAEGFSENNPAQKSAGGKLLIAGGGIMMVGFVMVPMLANLLSV